MNNGPHRRLALESIESRICFHGALFADNTIDLEFDSGRTEHAGELGNDWIVGGTGQDAKFVEAVRFAAPD